MDALLRDAESLKSSLENSARFLHLMPNEAPKAQNFLNQLNDKIAQLDKSDAKVQAKLPGLEAAVAQAAAAIENAGKSKEVDTELKALEALIKKAQDAARAIIIVPGSSLRPAEADVKKLSDAVAEAQPAFEAFANKYGTMEKAKAKIPTLKASLDEVTAKLSAAQDVHQRGSAADAQKEPLRTQVSTWSSKMQDFINRWHDESAYKVAMEALERLEPLIPALEQFADDSLVANTLKTAKSNIEKVHQNIPKAKARIESRPLLDATKKSRDKLQDFIDRPHVQSYYTKAMEGLEELSSLVPALEAYVADSDVESVLKSTKEKMGKAEALIPAAKVKFESAVLKDKVVATHRKMDDFISRPHVENYYNQTIEALEELHALVPALEAYASDSDVANALKAAKEKMGKAEALIPAAKLKFESAGLKDKVVATHRRMDDFISRPHVESYYNQAVEALDELNSLLPALEAYASDSDVANALKTAKEKIAKADALMAQARAKFAAAPLRNKVTELYRKLQPFHRDWHVKQYYDTTLEALEELKVALPELEQYASDSDVASTIKNAKESILKAEANIPQAKARFESGALVDSARALLPKITQFTGTWHHKPYYDAAVEAIETIESMVPALEQYSLDSQVESVLKSARTAIAAARDVFPKARARFEGEPLRDKVVATHNKLDNFIKTWHHKEYYDTAIEAIEELQSLIPALEVFTADDSYSAGVVKTAREKIVKAEANIPLAKARFESAALVDRVRALTPSLTQFAGTWHHKPYYDTAVDAIENIQSLLPMLEQYASDSSVESVIKSARTAIASAQANFPKARARFEGEPIRDKVVATHSKLDKFIKDWYYKDYYNEAIEALEELQALIPALEVFTDIDTYSADVVKTARRKMAEAEANIPQAKLKFEAEPLKEQVISTHRKLDNFISQWYVKQYYDEAMEALDQLQALLPALEQYATDSHVSDVLKTAKTKVTQAEANISQAKTRFESESLLDKTRSTHSKLDNFIKSWHYKEYYDIAIETLEELSSLVLALEAYSSDKQVAEMIQTVRRKMAEAEANIPQAKVKFEAEPLVDKVVSVHGKLDKFIKDWYYKDYYNEAVEAMDELSVLIPALEVYSSNTRVSEVIATARRKIAEAEANIPQAKVKFESAALKDEVVRAHSQLDKFIKEWYVKQYYDEALEVLDQLQSLVPALVVYESDSHVADVIKTARGKIAQAEANIPQAKVKFEAEPLQEQVRATHAKLDNFIKSWHHKEYYDTAMEAIDELSGLLSVLEQYSSDQHVSEVIKTARGKIAQAEANVPQAKLKFEAEPLKNQVVSIHAKLDKFIKDWHVADFYNEAMDAIEQLTLLLPALEMYAADTHVSEVIKTARGKIAQAEANVPQAKARFESAALKDQVVRAHGKLDNFIKSWQYKDYYDVAVEAIEELNMLLPALETYSSDSHVAEVIKTARGKIAQAEANVPQAKLKFESEPLRDKVTSIHNKLDNFIKTWSHKEYYDTAVEAIEELEELLPALQAYESDEYIARVIKTARDKITAARGNFPQARARFEAEPLRAKVSQVHAKLDNFIKTWQHEEYYNTAIEAMEELQSLLPALEEFASDSGVATVLRVAKEKIAKAEANVPLAKLKFATEPLRNTLEKTASKLDSFIGTWHSEAFFNTAIEAIEELSQLLPALEPYAADARVAATIKSAKEKIAKAEANFPQAKARFESKPLEEMVSKSSFKLLNFIKSWHHEEYYNTAKEALTELEALLPALEVYSSDSGVATTIKVAKERIQAAKGVEPQAKLRFEAEPLKHKVSQTAAKLDNFIKSWHHEEYFNTATDVLAELAELLPALEAYAADSHVSTVIASAKEKMAKAEANIPLAKAKFEAEPLRRQVQQHFDKLNSFTSQWWVEANYNAAVEALEELNTLVPRLATFADAQAEATVRLAKEKIQAAQVAMKSAGLKFEAEPLRKKAEAAVTQLKTASGKWNSQESFEQGIDLQKELQDLVAALQRYQEDSATQAVLNSANQALAASEARLAELRVKYHLQPAVEEARKTVSTLSTFIAKWLQLEEYQKGVDAIAKSGSVLEKLAVFGALTEAQAAAEQLKKKVAEAEQQVKVAAAKHGVIKPTASAEGGDEEDEGAPHKGPISKAPWTPYKPPAEPEYLVPEPSSFLQLPEKLDPPADLNVGSIKTFVTPLEEQLARTLGTAMPINFNWDNWVTHPSFTSKPDSSRLELIKAIYQTVARQVVGAIAQMVGADQVARTQFSKRVKRVVVQYDPTDMVFDGRYNDPVKVELNKDGDLIVTTNMSPKGTIQIENPLRNKLDVILNISIVQAQTKTLARMKEVTDKARINAYLDIEFAPFALHPKFLVEDPKEKMKACARFWETFVPTAAYQPAGASVATIQSIMKAGPEASREALQRYVRRVAFTWDYDDSVSSPCGEDNPGKAWYKIDLQDNNEVLVTFNSNRYSEKLNREFEEKWRPVMSIFTEKYVSETKLRQFEKKVSDLVGKKIEAEINWQPTIRSHQFKSLGPERVTKVLKGLHTIQLNYLAEIYKSACTWTQSGKRILGERIDKIHITLEERPAGWSLNLVGTTLYITMGWDETNRRRDHLQEDIEWITEATIPIEIEAANRDCAKLSKELGAQAKKDIKVGINWDAFVGLPDFVRLGHDTVVTHMRNVYHATSFTKDGLIRALSHDIGCQAIVAAIDAVEMTLDIKYPSAQPTIALNGTTMGLTVGYNAAKPDNAKILQRRERVENLLDIIVQVHKALAQSRYQAVVDGLTAALGRPVPIEADWSIVDTPQFKSLLPEEKSLVVELIHATFPEVVVTDGVLRTNEHPVGKQCYARALKRVYFRVTPESALVNSVESKGGELHVSMDLPSVVAKSSVVKGTWRERAEEAFDMLVPIAQYDALEKYNNNLAADIAKTVGKELALKPNWDFVNLPAFKDKPSTAKRNYILDYCNLLLSGILFGAKGLSVLCGMSLVQETIANTVDAIVIKVDPSINTSAGQGPIPGRPTQEGKDLVFNVAIHTEFAQGASWGQHISDLLNLRPVIIQHFLTRYGPEQLAECGATLSKAIGATLAIEMDLAEVLNSETVKNKVLFHELKDYLTTLYRNPARIVTGQAGLVWICSESPTAREQLVSRVSVVRLVIDTTNSTPPFVGHKYQTEMYQVRVIEPKILVVQFNQEGATKLDQDLGEVVEWELTPEIARKKEKDRIEEERERARRYEEERRHREAEDAKERRHREMMNALRN